MMNDPRLEATRHDPSQVEDDATNPLRGAQLLDDLREFIKRFCVFPSEACLDAVTLWVAHTHMVEHFHTTPRLALLSPEPASGKTRVLEVLYLLTSRAMSMISPAVAPLFRKLSKEQVTFLFDECDTIFSRHGKNDHNEDVRALINSGYKRGATVPRCVGSQYEVQEFPCYAAVALAGLGELPDTIMSRAIIIKMRRRTPSEKVEQFRWRLQEKPGHDLRDQLSAWAVDVGVAVGESWPKLPEGVEDRKAEVWEPIIAVADQAGGSWPERARAACVDLIKVASERRVSLGLRLLADLQAIFLTSGIGNLSTQTILRSLWGEESLETDGNHAKIADDAPWSELRGKRLDARGLARLLKPYGVSSTKVKENGKSLQGYRVEDLWDVWMRYLPQLLPAGTELVEPPSSIGSAGSAPAEGKEVIETGLI
jgi:hypothetical protein